VMVQERNSQEGLSTEESEFLAKVSDILYQTAVCSAGRFEDERADM